jgi:flagellar hook-basal body complex protein FliE
MAQGIAGIGQGIRMPQELPDLQAGTGAAPGAGAGANAAEGGFASTFREFLGGVNDLQHQADQQFQAFVRGDAELHDVAIAMREAEIALQLTTEIRDRLLQAYQEVMRTAM